MILRFWRSIFLKPVLPGTGQERKWSTFDNIILHVHPRSIPEKTLQFTLTWGLGGMSVVLVLMLALTGVMLLFVYEPFPDRAYNSIITLQNEVWFGRLVRNVHHWSGNFLVIITFLHMLRVFFTGAFHQSRQFNWIVGLSLFGCVLLSNFSGYLLTWDQLSFWAITICISMFEYIPGVGIRLQNLIRGGTEIGPATLQIFFTLHTTVIPAGFVMLMPLHFWRIRKTGGVVIPRNADDKSYARPVLISTIPNLVLREATVGLILVACIMVYSIFFNAPLENPANPGLSPNPAKAPWYFMWVQEMLMHFHPFFAVFLIPAAAIGALLLLPYIKYDSSTGGVWFLSSKGKKMGMVSAVAAIVITPVGIIADEFFMDFTNSMSGVFPVIIIGLAPVTLILAFMIGYYRIIKKAYSASNNEAIQSLFVLLLVSFIILTVTGIWFRGKGMSLSWP